MESPLTPGHRHHRSYRITIALLWVAMALVAVVFRRALLPFALAMLIAYVIEPLVARIAARRVAGRPIPRWAAILLLYALFFLSLGLFSVAALPKLYGEAIRLTAEARDFLNSLTPQRIAWYITAAEEWLVEKGIPIALGDPYLSLGEPTAVQPGAAELAIGADVAQEGARIHLDVAESIRTAIANASAWLRTHFFDLVGWSQQLVAGLFGGIFNLFFVLMVTAFLLVDSQGILAYFRSLVPPEHRENYDGLLRAIDVKLSGAVRGQIVICLVNGLLTLTGLLLLEVKFAFILATLATILSFIPIFGTILSTIPIVLVGLTQSFTTGLLALGWILAIHALEAYLLNPKILGTSAHIHPALVALAILLGERTFGFVGALFAVPVASILLAAFGHFKARAERLAGIEPEPAAPAPTAEPSVPGLGGGESP